MDLFKWIIVIEMVHRYDYDSNWYNDNAIKQQREKRLKFLRLIKNQTYIKLIINIIIIHKKMPRS